MGITLQSVECTFFTKHLRSQIAGYPHTTKSPIADPGSDVIFRHGADGGKGGKLKALIIDGRNNHDWKTTTPILKQILETAYSAEETGGTDVHEPMIWIIPYGEYRMFTTVMGHAPYSMACTGFITTVQRGSEWAATGKVT